MGAARNALREEETKESIIDLYLDLIDRSSDICTDLATVTAERDAALATNQELIDENASLGMERDRLREASTVARVQREQRPWVAHNFGERPGWMPVLGLAEEVGELAHAFLKREQGIRGTKEQHDADIRDAAADLVIFLCDVASAEGFDLDQVISETWDMVRKRDFKADPAGGGNHQHTPPEAAEGE